MKINQHDLEKAMALVSRYAEQHGSIPDFAPQSTNCSYSCTGVCRYSCSGGDCVGTCVGTGAGRW